MYYLKKANSKNIVLILTPSPELWGGVTNYYNSIMSHFNSNQLYIERFIVGRRPGKKSNIYYLLNLTYDLTRLFIKLFNHKYVLIHLNPSLEKTSIIRDSLFLLIAKLHSKKILVHWRGWKITFVKLIERNDFLMRLFRKIFNNADAFIVLASSFKNKLKSWKFKQEIFIDTTTVDDCLLAGFSPEKKIKEIVNCNKFQILFFSRLEIAKGIIETINAFSALNMVGRSMTLVIAGDGRDYDIVKKYVNNLGDARIKLIGYVRRDEKRKVLENSHLMCLPSEDEGLPNAMLEAMAFGIPILTKPIGGIPDNFIDGENGYYIQSLEIIQFSKLLSDVISNKENLAKIALNNYKIAQKRFLSSVVTKRLDNIYRKILFK